MLVAALLPTAVRHAGPGVVGSRSEGPPQATIGALPLSFVPNAGQEPAAVRYAAHGADTSLYFTPRGLTIAQAAAGDRRGPAGGGPARWAVRLGFPGAEPVEPVAGGRTGAVTSFFHGPPSEWRTGLPSYSRVAYPGLWPGIDLVFSGSPGQLKYEFRVAPGADPGRIAMAYRGATGVDLTPAGTLRIVTPVGGFTDDVPRAWQETDGGRLPVEAAYVAGPGKDVYRFRLGPHDPALPLVVDPAILLSAGYIGGTGTDQGRGVALDGEGNIYVAGTTTSAQDSFPVTVGPDLTYNGITTAQGPDPDAFVAKLDPSGTNLLYAGYIGGEKPDLAYGIDVDAAGNAYVTGATKSHDKFPLKAGPTLNSFKGAFEGFISKVNPEGTDLVYSAVIAGSRYDSAHDVEVDAGGNAYLVGMTRSEETHGFPLAVGPDLTFNGGGGVPHPPYDAWVGRVNAEGTALDYLGYIGGAESDGAMGLGIDTAGAAYVGGYTESTEATFPATVGPDLTFNGGGLDVFVAKVAPGGASLAYAGYIGGAGDDSGFGVGDGIGLAVDSSGSAYLTGQTQSNQTTFPVRVGPDLTHNGASDAFVSKVKPDGTELMYAGYIGGKRTDSGVAIALDPAGSAHVTGQTASPEDSFPVTQGPDLTFNGGSSNNPQDAFVAKVLAEGTGLAYAGYIGGAADDYGRNIAVDGSANAYVTGITASDESSFPVSGGPDTTHNGGDDAFVARVSFQDIPSANLALSVTDEPDPVEVGAELTYTLTVTNQGPDPATGAVLMDTLPSTATFVSVSTSQGTCIAPDGSSPGGMVECDLGAMAPGATADVTITVTPTEAGTITNQAEVTAAEQDAHPADNVAISETTVVEGGSAPGADLALAVTDSPDPVEVGSEVRYELTVANSGSADATEVTVTDQLPPEVIFQEATTTQGTCTVPPGTAPGETVSCSLGTIPTGGSATVSIVVIPVVAGQITNQAETSSPDDGDASDNVAVATTDVQGTSCTMIGTKSSDRLTGTAGDDVICGLRNGDLLKGIQGNDVIYGGPGNDVIEGGDGDDFLSGAEGPDRLTGGAGADSHAGGTGPDNIDTRDGIGGNDVGNGGPDTDTCRFDPGDVVTDCP